VALAVLESAPHSHLFSLMSLYVSYPRHRH
jgi:hypothetical protein